MHASEIERQRWLSALSCFTWNTATIGGLTIADLRGRECMIRRVLVLDNGGILAPDAPTPPTRSRTWATAARSFGWTNRCRSQSKTRCGPDWGLMDPMDPMDLMYGDVEMHGIHVRRSGEIWSNRRRQYGPSNRSGRENSLAPTFANRRWDRHNLPDTRDRARVSLVSTGPSPPDPIERAAGFTRVDDRQRFVL
jgi:hypothetical protein